MVVLNWVGLVDVAGPGKGLGSCAFSLFCCLLKYVDRATAVGETVVGMHVDC